MKSLVMGISIVFAYSTSAIALPDMSSSSLIAWSRNNQLISPLRRPSGSDLDPSKTYISSERDIAGGKISLTIFLNDRGVVTEEALAYRPSCYFNDSNISDCQGAIRFEQSDQVSSRSLISKVWGKQVVSDFLGSKLSESFGQSSGFVRRWYQGKIYNYETSHYQRSTINNFIVVSKRSSQAQRIQQYKHCENNPRSCGP